MRGVTQLLKRFGKEKEMQELINEFGAAHELSESSLSDQINLGRLTQLTADEMQKIKMKDLA